MMKPTMVVHRFTPAYVTNGSSGSFATYVITPPVAPTLGNIIMVFFGANNSATLTGSPTGFIQANGSTVVYTSYAFYKTVTASEPATYTFTFSGTLNGGCTYIEFSGVALYPVDIPLTGATGASAAITTFTSASFDVITPGIAFSCIGKNTSTAWNPGGTGWNIVSGAGQQKMAYKVFSDIALAQTVTWTGTSASINHFSFMIRSKEIRF